MVLEYKIKSYKVQLKILHEVKRRLTKGWTQKAYARDEFGGSVDMDYSRACQWCLVGAMFVSRAHVGAFMDDLAQVDNILCQKAKTGELVQWNDRFGRTKEEVLDLVQHGIDVVNARLKAEQANLAMKRTIV
jgi:hypothetical protein